MRGWFNRRVLINKVGLSQPKVMIVSLAHSLMCNWVSGFFFGLQLSTAHAQCLSFISPTRLHDYGGLLPKTCRSSARSHKRPTAQARVVFWLGKKVPSRITASRRFALHHSVTRFYFICFPGLELMLIIWHNTLHLRKSSSKIYEFLYLGVQDIFYQPTFRYSFQPFIHYFVFIKLLWLSVIFSHLNKPFMFLSFSYIKNVIYAFCDFKHFHFNKCSKK